MTSLERILGAARRQTVDRVPVAPYLGNHGAWVAGVRLGDYWMPVYLEAIRRLAEMTHGAVAVRAPGTGPFSLASHLRATVNQP